MGARTKKRAVWVNTESTYGTDADANADGAEYTWIPAFTISDLKDGKEPLETNYATGRPWKTAPIAGPDGWEFTITTPVIGMASVAADTAAASTVSDDWLDEL